jgi:hypothetical protein
LRFVRRRCGHCKSETYSTTAIYVEDSPTIQRLLTVSRALGLGSQSSVKSTSIPTKKSQGESTDLDFNATPSGLAFRYSSVFWIGCGGDSVRPIPTQMLQHRLTSAADSAFVPSCFLPEKATQLQSLVGPTFLSSNRELVTAQSLLISLLSRPHFWPTVQRAMLRSKPANGCIDRSKTISRNSSQEPFFCWHGVDMIQKIALCGTHFNASEA